MEVEAKQFQTTLDLKRVLSSKCNPHSEDTYNYKITNLHLLVKQSNHLAQNLFLVVTIDTLVAKTIFLVLLYICIVRCFLRANVSLK